MPQKAQEIFKYAKRKRAAFNEQTLKSLKERSVDAVTSMMRMGDYVTELELDSDDMNVIHELTNEMKGLGYRYCLIEEQDEEAEVLGYRFRISISHLDLK